jgi:hypothetical protein
MFAFEREMGVDLRIPVFDLDRWWSVLSPILPAARPR